jgi:dipeptidyl aminopeptidase/acylaminoacyl peptidase
MENMEQSAISTQASAEEKFSVAVDGIEITGEISYPPGRQIAHPGLCLCHGIPAPNLGPPDGGYPQLARHCALEGFVACAFNFRGTGQSGGNLDLLGWTRDLEAVVSRLIKIDCVDKSRIFLMGFSAGAATSVYVAAHDKRISALVSCACPAEFSSLRLDSLLEQCRSLGAIRDEFFSFSLTSLRISGLLLKPAQRCKKKVMLMAIVHFCRRDA